MITREEVQHIAKLARLGLKEAEIKKFQKDLSSILEYFTALKELKLSETEPTFHPTENFFEKGLEGMREDKAEPQPIEVVNSLIEAAPERKGRQIKVKAIL